MSIYKHDLSYLLCFCVAAIQLSLTAHNPHQNAYQHNIGFRRPVVKLKCRIIVNKTVAAICTGVNAIGTMLTFRQKVSKHVSIIEQTHNRVFAKWDNCMLACL